MKKKNGLSFFLQDRGILIALLTVWVLAAIFNPNFRNFNTYVGILRESSFLAISAIGMTFAIMCGVFDLSLGSMLAFIGMIVVMGVDQFGTMPMLLFAIFLGLCCGGINGFLISVVKIPAFIATLGMMFIYRSMASMITNGNFVQTDLVSFTMLGNDNFLGLPISFLCMVALGILGKIILVNTKFGRHICAVGNSEKASRISGIDKNKVLFFTFVIVGLYNAIAAFFMTSRLWSANPWMKESYGFDVIAAVVIGGTSMNGGKGSIFNSCIGAIFLSSINTIMNMFHVSSFYQRVITGIILIIAVCISGIKMLIDKKIMTNAIRKEHVINKQV